jgi:hypothetical protein
VASNKVKTALFLLRRGCWGTLMQEIRKVVNSDEVCYGFRRDLAEPFEPPKPVISIQLRPFRNTDAAHLFDLSYACRQGGSAIMDCLHDLAFIEAGIPRCFVATTDEGSPCYIQWLISHTTNDRLESHFKGYMPPLARDEVVLEGAFIPFRYRGKKIMPFAMARVAEKGKDVAARFAMTYVQDSNLPSIKGVLQAGFSPYVRRVAIRRRSRTEIKFELLTEDEKMALEAVWRDAFSKGRAILSHPSLENLPLAPPVSQGSVSSFK